MFVIILKEIENIHAYFRQTINGFEFERIRNFKDLSGFTAYIFYSEIEAKERLKKIQIQYSACRSMEFHIVSLNELETFVEKHFEQ